VGVWSVQSPAREVADRERLNVDQEEVLMPLRAEPRASEEKAICLPSGDHVGSRSV